MKIKFTLKKEMDTVCESMLDGEAKIKALCDQYGAITEGQIIDYDAYLAEANGLMNGQVVNYLNIKVGRGDTLTAEEQAILDKASGKMADASFGVK